MHLSGGGEICGGGIVQPSTARAWLQGLRRLLPCVVRPIPRPRPAGSCWRRAYRTWMCGRGSSSLFFAVPAEAGGCLEMKSLGRGGETDESGPALPRAPWSRGKPSPWPLSISYFPSQAPRLGGGHRVPRSSGGFFSVFLFISRQRPSAPSRPLTPSPYSPASGAFAPAVLSSGTPSPPDLPLCGRGPSSLCAWAVCLQVGRPLPADTLGAAAPRLY